MNLKDMEKVSNDLITALPKGTLGIAIIKNPEGTLVITLSEGSAADYMGMCEWALLQLRIDAVKAIKVTRKAYQGGAK